MQAPSHNLNQQVSIVTSTLAVKEFSTSAKTRRSNGACHFHGQQSVVSRHRAAMKPMPRPPKDEVEIEKQPDCQIKSWRPSRIPHFARHTVTAMRLNPANTTHPRTMKTNIKAQVNQQPGGQICAQTQCKAKAPITSWQKSIKRVSRTFKLEIAVPLYYGLVQEVLDCIENDRLLVFRPDDEHALDGECNNAGDLLLNNRATIPISIREWLCVGCQLIDGSEGSFTRKGENDALAYYQYNSAESIFPDNLGTPPGPAAFIGKIHLSQNAMPPLENEDSEQGFNRFKFIVAHELVHVFDMMRLVVPAFMNWKAFWTKVLGEGCKCGKAQSNFNENSIFIDDYGCRNEFEQVKQYWPSHAEKWFKACHGASGVASLREPGTGIPSAMPLSIA